MEAQAVCTRSAVLGDSRDFGRRLRGFLMETPLNQIQRNWMKSGVMSWSGRGVDFGQICLDPALPWPSFVIWANLGPHLKLSSKVASMAHFGDAAQPKIMRDISFSDWVTNNFRKHEVQVCIIVMATPTKSFPSLPVTYDYQLIEETVLPTESQEAELVASQNLSVM